MTIYKPIILDTDGVLSQLPDGSIINAGGTSSSTFTVGGRGLLFDDGTSTGIGNGITLQTVYNGSPPAAGSANIALSASKDFSISNTSASQVFFRVDAETGKVVITGDLEVMGSSTIIDTVVQDSDHWLISPKSATTTPLKIEPDVGVNPIVDLVTVRRTFGTAPVFRIDSAGNLIATQNLTVGGLINGVDVAALQTEVTDHLSAAAGSRHMADDVDILPITSLAGSANVQEALESLNTKVDNIASVTNNTRGYEHVQLIASSSWAIAHNLNSRRAQLSIYDDQWEQIIPEKVALTGNNTALVTFSMPIAGRAVVVAF
jgi:hypothetical protein